MPFSSSLYTVDTVQIHPVQDALTEGTLLGGVPPSDVPVAPETWGDSTLNCVLTVISVIILILYLRKLVGLLPYLFRAFMRWRETSDIEDSMRVMRDRNAIAAAMVIPFCLVCSRYDVWRPEFMDGVGFGMKTILCICIFAAFLLIRAALIATAPPVGRQRDCYNLSNRAIYNFFILTVILVVISCLAATAFGANDLAVRRMAIIEGVVMWLVFLVRKMQILSRDCGQFKAFLYLCKLEILPAAIIIAAMKFL
jgi:hypothetical protein